MPQLLYPRKRKTTDETLKIVIYIGLTIIQKLTVFNITTRRTTKSVF